MRKDEERIEKRSDGSNGCSREKCYWKKIKKENTANQKTIQRSEL